ncbi:hypothetical protein MRX96_059653 [Rhipicephalus microplus]
MVQVLLAPMVEGIESAEWRVDVSASAPPTDEKRDARPLDRPTSNEAIPHEAIMEGQLISKEQAEPNGSVTAHRKRNADKILSENETRLALAIEPPVGATKELRKVATTSSVYRTCQNPAF